jgi:hypothetical protein
MKFLHLVALIALMFTGLHVQSQELPDSYAKLVKICDGLNNYNDCSREIEKFQSKSPLAAYFKREGTTLMIRTLSGNVKLKDTVCKTDSDCFRYSYQTYLRKIQIHVLHVGLYEGSGFFFVHQKSGATSSADGFPLSSPDSQRFVAISSAGEASYIPNSVEIWNVSKGALRAEYRYEPSTSRWRPKKARWIDSNTVKIDGECGEELGDVKNCPSVVLQYRGASWRLKWSL